MNIKVTTISIIFIAFALRQNSYGQVVAEQEYYDFFNSFINADSIEEFNLSSQPDFKYILEDTTQIFYGRDNYPNNCANTKNKDTTFSTADIAFIKQQLASGQKFKWTEGKILGSKIIQRKELDKYFQSKTRDGWEKYYKKYKSGFETLSIPLFSIDKTKCIVYRGGHCGGLCGGGRVYLFIKKNQKWEVKKIYINWIS